MMSVLKATAAANTGKNYLTVSVKSDLLRKSCTAKDITVAKNYLDENELKILNNLVSAFFDLAEVNAIEHKPMYMSDYVEQLDALITSGKRNLLEGAGKISRKQAEEKASTEYKKYIQENLSPVEEEYLKTISSINSIAKKKAKESNDNQLT